MYIYSGKQIKEADSEAERKGMALFALMENAGSGLYRNMIKHIHHSEKILILAGKGNNGGDGIVLARYFKNNGYDVKLVFPLGEPKTKTSIEHLDYYKSCGYKIDLFSKELRADWIVDGLLGVGSQSPLREDLAKITDWMNRQDCKMIAIDIPTGVSSDNGEVDEYAVRAQYTYALHGYKPSAFLSPSSEYYGEVEAVDIGLMQNSKWKVWTKEDVISTLPVQHTNTHKGTFGNGLLIAGSDEMPGSAALSAIGALRFGIGKLSIATTKHASSIIGTLAPEATFVFDFQSTSLEGLFSAVAIGPGLNPNEQLEEEIREILKRDVPVILDAGALSRRTYDDRTSPIIITPHPGEFRRLAGVDSSVIAKNRLHLASQYAQEHGVIVVLKGENTVIAYPDGTGCITLTGNRALSKGGTGDTLTGMLLASINTHEDIKEAIANAVFIHGYCGDQWVKKNGEQTMSAHDFDKLLPEVCFMLKREDIR